MRPGGFRERCATVVADRVAKRVAESTSQTLRRGLRTRRRGLLDPRWSQAAAAGPRGTATSGRRRARRVRREGTRRHVPGHVLDARRSARARVVVRRAAEGRRRPGGRSSASTSPGATRSLRDRSVLSIITEAPPASDVVGWTVAATIGPRPAAVGPRRLRARAFGVPVAEGDRPVDRAPRARRARRRRAIGDARAPPARASSSSRGARGARSGSQRREAREGEAATSGDVEPEPGLGEVDVDVVRLVERREEGRHAGRGGCGETPLSGGTGTGCPGAGAMPPARRAAPACPRTGRDARRELGVRLHARATRARREVVETEPRTSDGDQARARVVRKASRAKRDERDVISENRLSDGPPARDVSYESWLVRPDADRGSRLPMPTALRLRATRARPRPPARELVVGRQWRPRRT